MKRTSHLSREIFLCLKSLDIGKLFLMVACQTNHLLNQYLCLFHKYQNNQIIYIYICNNNYRYFITFNIPKEFI